ncbi:hypothetical protein FHS09_003266 [Microbulbifer rhizosphaerae]|uniref:Uncharacterized protein n=1 Tax=Microbulbifer rhizosphaerae TaxID=1562603 RepID=A0A7W4WDU3_9GAMM|nr:hypothetical protein [Microbulbifer rhizosphaerae]
MARLLFAINDRVVAIADMGDDPMLCRVAIGGPLIDVGTFGGIAVTDLDKLFGVLGGDGVGAIFERVSG